MKLEKQNEYNKKYSGSRRIAYFAAAAVLFVSAPVLASIRHNWIPTSKLGYNSDK